MKQLKTGELEFQNFEEASMYWATLLKEGTPVISNNDKNSETYKKSIVELRGVNYSIPGGLVLTSNLSHAPTPFWAISEVVSEILGMKRPIMDRYSPETMDWAYSKIFANRCPEYSYGERWSQNNQVMHLFDKLNKNLTSKRAVMSIYDGTDTYPEKSEVPCTLFHHFCCRDNKLDVTAYYRSWDFFAGNVYDTFLSNFLQQTFVSWLKKAGHTELQPGRLHFMSGSLHYYPSRLAEKLEKMLEFKGEDFYSDVEPSTFSCNIEQYYKDLQHLSEAELASYHGNLGYAQEKLGKIIDPLFRDYARVYLIKNSKHYEDLRLAKKFIEELELPEMQKWVNNKKGKV